MKLIFKRFVNLPYIFLCGIIIPIYRRIRLFSFKKNQLFTENSKDIYPERPIAFVLAASNHGTLIVNRFDFRKVFNYTYGVGHQILTKSSYEQSEINLVLDLLKARRKYYGDGVVAIDCGANIGTHTVEMAKLMHNWGRVIAIEAQEKIYYALAGNIAINNCMNVRAIWAVASNQSGKVNIKEPNYLTSSSFGSYEISSPKFGEFIGQQVSDSDITTETNVITIDDMNLDRLDLIKIDVEGMELEIISGAINTFSSCKPIIMAEVLKVNIVKLKQVLKNHDYFYYEFGINFVAIHNSDTTLSKIFMHRKN